MSYTYCVNAVFDITISQVFSKDKIVSIFTFKKKLN